MKVLVLCRSRVAMRATTIATASLLAGGATGTDRIFEDAAFAGDKVKPRRPNDQQGFTFYGGLLTTTIKESDFGIMRVV